MLHLYYLISSSFIYSICPIQYQLLIYLGASHYFLLYSPPLLFFNILIQTWHYFRGKMGEIDFTNIIIDDFRKGKQNPFNKYVYILTHVHTDHLRGLSNSWNYGPIYCSKITYYLILNKFPDLKHILKPVPLEEPYQIQLSNQLSATITLFDANHCAGAVFVLLQGYFGRFLYSGDFRFNEKKFRNYTYLYPPQRSNPSFQKCSLHIDKLWLDNTFCNPKFTFPAQQDVLKIIEDFIKQNLGKRIYIGMDYYGKQQALVHIAKVFDTIIVVDEQRYETIITMEFDRQYFTTNPNEGLIQVVPRKNFHQKLIDNPQALGMVMSGWANKAMWRNVKDEKEKKRIYYVPYSLHSNYNQIVAFVRSIQPSAIDPVVPLDQKPQQSIVTTLYSMYSTEDNAQSFRQLVKKFKSAPSAQYQKNCQDPSFFEVIKKKLGLDRKTAEINKTQLGLNTFHMPARGRGYKLNQVRNEEQIEKMKQQLKKKKEKREAKKCEIVISEDDDDNESNAVEIIEKSDKVNDKKDSQNEQIFIEEEESDVKEISLDKKEEELMKQDQIQCEKQHIQIYQEDQSNQKENVKAKNNNIYPIFIKDKEKDKSKQLSNEKNKKEKGKAAYERKIKKDVGKSKRKQRAKNRPDLSKIMNVPMISTNEQQQASYFQDIKKLLETINQAVSIIGSLNEK